MTRYQAPPSPLDDFEVGCLRVYFPDSPLLFRALRAQLTELESRFVWDTDNDIAAAEKLEQDWLRAGLLTFEAIGQGCGDDCTECEDTIIDLTTQLEECQETIQEYENMQITVNCNCGCCDGNSYPTPVGDDGQPIDLVNLPLDPNDPFGDDVPVWDDLNETPPSGWTDWEEFIDSRCLMANYFIDSYIATVKQLDELENQGSLGKSLLEILAVFIALIPGPVGDGAGALVVLNWLRRVIVLLSDILNEFEDINDILQLISSEVEDHREELICMAYQASSVEFLQAFWREILTSPLTTTLTTAGMSSALRDQLVDALMVILDDFAPLVQEKASSYLVPEDYVPTFDCATCNAASGYDYTPGTIAEVNQIVASSGITDTAYTLAPDGSYVQASALASGGGKTFALELHITPPPVSPDWQYVGMALVLIGGNVDTLNIYDFAGDVGKLWDGGEQNYSEGELHILRSAADTYPDTMPGVNTIVKSNATNIEACTIGNDGIRLGIKTAAPGATDFTIKHIRWIRKLDLAC